MLAHDPRTKYYISMTYLNVHDNWLLLPLKFEGTYGLHVCRNHGTQDSKKRKEIAYFQAK